MQYTSRAEYQDLLSSLGSLMIELNQAKEKIEHLLECHIDANLNAQSATSHHFPSPIDDPDDFEVEFCRCPDHT